MHNYKHNSHEIKCHKFKRLPIAFAVATICSSVPLNAIAKDESVGRLEEVMVTATRRSQSVQDIPYNISALTSKTIKDAGITNIDELARIVPGLSVTETGGRSLNNDIYLRGAKSDPAGFQSTIPNVAVPTTSTYLGEAPAFVNIKLTDIERIEVLRGPQGTLYGSGSVGGTVRFIFNKPNFESVSGNVSTSMSQKEDADDLSHTIDGTINIPLTDNLAFRAVAGYEDSAGFIDANKIVVTEQDSLVPVLADPSDPFGSGMVFQTLEDTNDAQTQYYRAALLWNVNDNVEVLTTFIHQEDSIGDMTAQTPSSGPFGTPGIDDRTHGRYLRQRLDRNVDVGSIDISADLGFATLTSSTSFYEEEVDTDFDFSGTAELLHDLLGVYPGLERQFRPIIRATTNEGFTEEIRLVSNSEGPFNWVAGFFYSEQEATLRERSPITALPEWANLPNPSAAAALGMPGATFADFLRINNGASEQAIRDGSPLNMSRDVEADETSIFGEISYDITDAWQVTVGARAFWINNKQNLSQEYPLCGPSCSPSGLDPRGTNSSDSDQDFQDQVYKLNTSYDFNDETMFYATWAEGFRRGGANGLPTAGPFAESASLLQFAPDSVENIEVGVKGSLINKFQYTLALYRMDWQDMQIDTGTTPAGIPFVANGGDVTSQGLELEVFGQLTENLSFTFGYSYTDATVTEDFVNEGTSGKDGDRLPGIPENKVSISLNYSKQLESIQGAELLLHLDGTYQDDWQTAINAANTNYTIVDAYDRWNASASIIKGNWRAGLFVNNITDELARTGAQIFAFWPQHSQLELIGQPRTIGFRLEYNFE